MYCHRLLRRSRCLLPRVNSASILSDIQTTASSRRFSDVSSSYLSPEKEPLSKSNLSDVIHSALSETQEAASVQNSESETPQPTDSTLPDSFADELPNPTHHQRNNFRRRDKGIPIVIENEAHDGCGFGYADGKPAVVFGAITGETVLAVPMRNRKQRTKMKTYKTIEVRTASEHRVEPKCPHFKFCGGCLHQHVDEEFQLHMLNGILRRQFHDVKMTPDVYLPPFSAAFEGYRRRGRLSVMCREHASTGEEKLYVGWRDREFQGSVTDIDQCLILDQRVGSPEIFEALHQMISSLSCRKRLPQIEVSVGDNISAFVFRVLDPLTRSDAEKMIAFGKAHNIFIYAQPSNPESTIPLYQGEEEEWSICLDTLFPPRQLIDVIDCQDSTEEYPMSDDSFSAKDDNASLDELFEMFRKKDNTTTAEQQSAPSEISGYPDEILSDGEYQPLPMSVEPILVVPDMVEFYPLEYHITTPFGTYNMDFHPHSFIQINRDMNEMIINEVIHQLHIQPSDIILDMFCGLGNLSIPVAGAGPSLVLAAELNEFAVHLGRHNAEKNNVENIQFYDMNLYAAKIKKQFVRSDMAVQLSSHLLSSALHSSAELKVILDPPRSGADMLIESDLFNPQHFPQLSTVVYVSCNPSTLARDAARLQSKGFHLKSVRLCNMFPHTGHAEAIAVFTRNNEQY